MVLNTLCLSTLDLLKAHINLHLHAVRRHAGTHMIDVKGLEKKASKIMFMPSLGVERRLGGISR